MSRQYHRALCHEYLPCSVEYIFIICIFPIDHMLWNELPCHTLRHGHLRNILRKIYMSGSRLVVLCILKGKSHYLRYRISPHNPFCPLGYGCEQCFKIKVLVGGKMHFICAHLPGYSHHRCPVNICICHTGNKVRGTRS